MSIFRDFFVKEKPVFTGITRGLGGFGSFGGAGLYGFGGNIGSFGGAGAWGALAASIGFLVGSKFNTD